MTKDEFIAKQTAEFRRIFALHVTLINTMLSRPLTLEEKCRMIELEAEMEEIGEIAEAVHYGEEVRHVPCA